MSSNSPALLEADDVSVAFPVSEGFGFSRRLVQAVDSVSLRIEAGQTWGLVGESGSGKSTLGRALLHLEKTRSGQVRFDGRLITGGHPADIAVLRQQTAMVFQDPFSSLNPRQSIGASIAEVLRVHGKASSPMLAARVNDLLQLVGLSPEQATSRPRALSGGQCQRAAIARALAMQPRLIVADECVSALDVSIQAQIINLLIDLRERMGMAMLFIAHDLGVVRRLCDQVAVMYLGRIVEMGPTREIFDRPLHPYTAALVSAIPEMDPDRSMPAEPLLGDPPSPVSVPAGCAFHPRCVHASPACRQGPPPALRRSGERAFACVLEHSSSDSIHPATKGA